MEAAATVVIGFIVFITPATPRCEALFFTAARKLHTKGIETDSVRLRQGYGPTLSLGERKWRRGELNPCPRRYPRKHLHVYPAINSEEPSHAPAHCRLPSVREIDSQIGAVAPPICQPAVHVCRRSRRPASNVAVN